MIAAPDHVFGERQMGSEKAPTRSAITKQLSHLDLHMLSAEQEESHVFDWTSFPCVELSQASLISKERSTARTSHAQGIPFSTA